MWNKIAAVAITATVLGLAAPASAQMYVAVGGEGPTIATATAVAGGAGRIAITTTILRAIVSSLRRGITTTGAGGMVTEAARCQC
jgi:hypothetical protein